MGMLNVWQTSTTGVKRLPGAEWRATIGLPITTSTSTISVEIRTVTMHLGVSLARDGTTASLTVVCVGWHANHDW